MCDVKFVLSPHKYRGLTSGHTLEMDQRSMPLYIKLNLAMLENVSSSIKVKVLSYSASECFFTYLTQRGLDNQRSIIIAKCHMYLICSYEKSLKISVSLILLGLR